jgi:hypothetical protein
MEEKKKMTLVDGIVGQAVEQPTAVDGDPHQEVCT